ncbi:MAG: hypothetical protein HF314_15925 [Ignavibacteria bacterium]|nr:hypothetical protein [Ignavibacteria bacterium]MCU7504569.1 hypothetical protein [Ignavibacteria bacterium]MCU7516593.1 hypothetical protein [Ignavibacteria bacterium]
MRKVIPCALMLLLFFLTLASVLPQEHKPHMGRDSVMQMGKDTVMKMDHDMDMRMHKTAGSMEGSPEPFQPASGTSWLPKSSPSFGYMSQVAGWMLMFHGNIFLRYNSQDVTNKGSRGASKYDAPDWFMAMTERSLGKGNKLKFSLMMSLDPLLVGGNGYPLLFQSGETYEDRPLVDRQHPHDFFSELSAEYTYSFSRHFALNAYLAYPGEPAIGPVAFMHRPSAQNDPDSPIGHHWQDATHITFGVATLGLRLFSLKIEGSVFSGREPNENRYNFDKPEFDSYSGRISFNPTDDFSFQTSYAFIKGPESLHPEENIHRTTASVLHSTKLLSGGFINSAIIWGFNYLGSDDKEHSVTLESDLDIKKFAFYGRYEWIEKSAEELELLNFESKRLFPVNAVTLGVNYLLLQFEKTGIRFGIQGSLFTTVRALEYLYGKSPLSLEVYFRAAPGIMNM